MSGILQVLVAGSPRPPSGTVDLSSIDGQSYADPDLGDLSSDEWVLLEFNAAGDIDVQQGYGTDTGVVGSWLSSGVDDGLFELRFTLNSGSVGTATGNVFDTWVAMSTEPNVWVANADDSDPSANITVAIRYAGGAILDSATFTLSAYNYV